MQRTDRAGLAVDARLDELIADRVLPGTGVTVEAFWSGFARLVGKHTQRNRALLAERSRLQLALDQWHREHPGPIRDPAAYRQMLNDIGYLYAPPEQVSAVPANVDPEIAKVAGPQLVVPVKNARFALNAANARWGSLYDALYGTDVIDETDGAERSGGYNPERGRRVIAYARRFLDDTFPLSDGSHADATDYQIDAQGLLVACAGRRARLVDGAAFRGYRDSAEAPTAILLCNHGLHVEIQIDREHAVGRDDAAGVADILMESAVSTIQDCEDSVAAVDAEDKAEVYGNWLGLMRGDLTSEFQKGEQRIERRLASDREYLDAAGNALRLPGRSLMLVRNVGIHMLTDAVLDNEGDPIYEGLLDAAVTSACAMHDLAGARLNSRAGSIYIVKPKLHGPVEVAFACDVFADVEDLLGLDRNTIKIGIMDEERRTTVNLARCIDAARERVIFINTGFLDRTGDEIHTDMEAGAVVRKEAIKQEAWIAAYEDWNVDVGLACGLSGRAQIGKGMWPKPDQMAEMVATKAAHPKAGANCAWVPSPTAATLHALHYHQVDVFARQRELRGREPARLETLLQLPLAEADTTYSAADLQAELDNNCQGLLGYVVRWVEHGVGCSKVPDINGEGLMEDRATLRISSQHLANWLRHDVCSADQVDETLRRMARVVDEQNADDPDYVPMAGDFDGSLAFQAARALIFEGCEQPNGYTEPLLHEYRRRAKSA